MKRGTVRTVLSSCRTLLVAVPTLTLIFSLVACKEAAAPAAVPTQLSFLGGPTNAIAGAALTPGVRVAILDVQGNTVTTATTSVTLAIGTNSAGGSLSGTVTESAVNGVATFSNLSINKADTAYTLSASAAGVSGTTSTTFSVTAGTASQLAFTAQPATTMAGIAIPAVAVAVQDALGNTVTTSTTSVALTFGTNPVGGTLAGTATVAAIGGVATFSNLSVNNLGTGYTLSASAAGVSGATSTAFSVTVGTASQLAFTAQPATTVTGRAIPAVAVAVQDALGNTVTTATTDIALTIGTNPAGGTLSGTTTVAAVSGVATFSNVSINNVGTGYTLRAVGTSLTSATSTPFDVAPAAPVTLMVTNSACGPTSAVCDTLHLLIFPNNQPLTPGGFWSISLGDVTTATACLVFPARDSFLVYGPSGLEKTFIWTPGDSTELGAFGGQFNRFMARPTTAEFVPMSSSGWTLAYPPGSGLAPATACHS